MLKFIQQQFIIQQQHGTDNFNIMSKVQWIAGTSTGAILAACLCEGNSRIYKILKI